MKMAFFQKYLRFLRKKDVSRKEEIVFITDDNYVKPTITAITSLIINKPADFCFDIHILTTQLAEENRILLEQLSTPFVNIDIMNKSEIISQYAGIDQNRHVTPAALLKFFIPQIFPKADKILYLDGDIIVQKGFEKIFDINLEGYYSAVVKDILCKLNKKHMVKYHIDNEFYFNTGVLFLNLDKMRRDNIPEKLMDWRLTQKNHFMDQDAFNAVIGSNVKYISYKYNFLNFYLERLSPDDLSGFFDEKLPENDKSIYKGCYIVHLGGPNKPWIYNMGYLSNLYKRYRNKSILKKEKLKLINLSNSDNFMKKIFSVRNDERKLHKIITVFGVKIKIKRKF